MWAAGLASIPVIGLFKPIWDALFYHPEKAAARRPDVLAGKRSLANAKQLEQEKKNAQFKAALLPALIAELGFIVFEYKYFKLYNELFHINMKETNLAKQLLNFYRFFIETIIAPDKIKANLAKLEHSVDLQHLAFQESIFQILNIVTPLALYALFENPESPEFNKAL
jgi:hypothetical protein